MEDNSITNKIKELFELYKNGAISSSEYDQLKAELIRKSVINKNVENETNQTDNSKKLNENRIESISNDKNVKRKFRFWKWIILSLVIIVLFTFILYIFNRKLDLFNNENYVETVNGVTFEMVYVEGGTFTMGCTSEQGSDCESNERPTHQVTLSSYYMGKFEVTKELWQAVMGSNPSSFNGTNLPVENVSWDDIQEFIRNLNNLTGHTYRLPTEAEWEFAARGGNKSNHYKYSGSNSIDQVAWYYGNSSSTTHSVGTKQPNELGIYDMSGNVWEWCQDWYGDYSSNAQTNPKGSLSGWLSRWLSRSDRVLRGGSWGFLPGNCRVSYRINHIPNYGGSYGFFGFRLFLVQ